MTHRLSNPNEPGHAVGLHPMTASLRYRCACGNQELLNIQVVFDADCEERRFLETMKQLFLDMHFEIKQHLKVQA